ncbi:MAG: response regulator transcription factor [Chloroflexota bacterium]
MDAIRVQICDDQLIVAEGLQFLLESDPAITVSGIAADGVEALALLEETTPDIVLMDLKMPNMNGVEAIEVIQREWPRLPVLVLTTFDADEWVFDAIRAGASGYLLKDTPRAQLIAAVKETVAGKTFLDPAIAGKLLPYVASGSMHAPSALPAQLTDREISILKLIARGMTNAAIAEALFLSEGTVRNYMSAMFDKLNVKDRTQAAVLALRHGIITTD